MPGTHKTKDNAVRKATRSADDLHRHMHMDRAEFIECGFREEYDQLCHDAKRLADALTRFGRELREADIKARKALQA